MTIVRDRQLFRMIIVIIYDVTGKNFCIQSYNTASGEFRGSTDSVTINRFNIGGGVFFTKNVLAKLEYVSQTYNDYPVGSQFNEGKFNGIALEAVVSF